MKGNDQTFSQLAESALTHILLEGVMSHRIDVVFDTYREDSIKNAERSNRGTTRGIQLRNMASGLRIQQWRKFLSSSPNKANLIRFKDWKTPYLRGKLNGKQLYVASEETCLRITNEQRGEVASLQSNQEETDTRIILHEARAAEEVYRAVVVTVENTDVMVRCLALIYHVPCSRNAEQRIGLGTLYINKLRHGLGDGVWHSLIGMHAYTGCDTTSAFVGRGKLGAIKLMR